MEKVSERKDAQLVTVTRNGDHEAYRELVSRYQGHVYGLAYSLVGNWADAQDIAQETFVRAYTNLDQLREPSRFAAWLRRVAFSVAMNWLNAFRPKLFSAIGDAVDLDCLEIPDFRPGPPEVLEKRDLADAVLRAVDSLPPKYRVPLTMFHLDGLSYQKVSDFLDIPLGTAKSLIYRAREKLKSALAVFATEEISPMVQEVFNEHKLGEEFAAKIIHGLEKVRWGGGQQENSFMGALAAAMQAMGENVSYEFLMGVSGAAFRLQIAQPDWCPSAPNAACGFNCIEPALDAVGYRALTHDTQEVKDDNSSAPDNLREAIVESINQGVPVMYSSQEESLIIGYENGGKAFLLRPYVARQDGYSRMRTWPWRVRILKKKGEPPDRRHSLIRSLEIALELANAEKFEPYASGFAAYEVWIANLLDESRFENQDPKAVRATMIANGHCYYSLLDARASAAIYLRSIAGEFEQDAAAHLLKAAELYQQIFDVLTKRCPTEIAPMPWMLKEGESWTQEMRDFQAECLKDVVPIERKAIAEMEKALEPMGE